MAGRLIATAITSLDGFVADREGKFDWAAPNEEVHRLVNDLERPIGTYLLGRRMYEVMRFWETVDAASDRPPVVLDYAAIWQAADKVVFSGSLEETTTARTHLERSFDPERVRSMKAEAASDLSVGGSTLAAHALRAGLVDELRVFLNPVVVGGGTHWLPDDVFLRLELEEERRLDGGVVFLRYRAPA